MSELDNLSSVVLPELSYDMGQEKSPEQAAIEHEQVQKDYSLAALIDHPGWKQIKDKMLADVERIRSLKDIDFKTYPDKELGEVVRSEFQLATKLEEYLSSVEEAVKAIKNGKQ